ncbi:MAG: manganese efflux pump MntP family protein [Planctomycetota bacterium]|nr:manganese efflux pump MntP family protein [Planctomycetota bacterium]
MGWLNIIGIALGLAMDAMAVSIAAGIALPRVTGRHVFRLAFHFGLFQFIMPVAGWFAGRAFAAYMHTFDHWVAFALLSFVGGKMLWEARSHEAKALRRDPTRGWTLLAFAVATSLDALAVGLSMALLGVSIWLPAVVIGLVAAAMSWLGVRFGTRLGKPASRWGDALGGLILIAIGARILIGHFLDSN